MQDQINQSMQQMQQMMEPTRKLNALLLNHAERIAHLNLEAARSYTELATQQMRKMLEIRDPESFQSYLTDQSKIMQTLSNKISEDANALADIGKDMGQEVQQIAQENASVVTEAVQQQTETAKGTAKGRSNSSSGGGSKGSGGSATTGSSSSASGAKSST
ncbi:MAG: TIGR01841 family phasin [Halorhodospira sp.]